MVKNQSMTNHDILKEDGYFNEYYRLYINSNLYQYQVWMKLESKLLDKYGINRYETIGSFKMAKKRYENKLVRN